MDLKDLATDAEPPRHRSPTRLRLRNYFLTGIVVAAPISITIYLTWSFIHWVDGWIKPLIPDAYNPDHYLPFSVPGFGLLVAILALTLLGFLTANLVGRTIVSYGEVLLDRMPLVRNLYRALKQIFQTALSESSRSFKQVGLIEYPRRELWSLVFVSTDAKGEIKSRFAENGQEMVSVFLPTTPNPTSGYLLFVPREDLMVLDMSVEEAAKLVISAGLVAPEYRKRAKPKEPQTDREASVPPAVAAE
jgi:uncharacterized membrane protein